VAIRLDRVVRALAEEIKVVANGPQKAYRSERQVSPADNNLPIVPSLVNCRGTDGRSRFRYRRRRPERWLTSLYKLSANGGQGKPRPLT
jgi:hypothetical protein